MLGRELSESRCCCTAFSNIVLCVDTLMSRQSLGVDIRVDGNSSVQVLYLRTGYRGGGRAASGGCFVIRVSDRLTTCMYNNKVQLSRPAR